MSDFTSRGIVSAYEPLREQVASALRAALIAGELRPGVVYSAPALAAGYGVSATPVREAMLDLVREGLVETVRNKGFRVTEMTERDLADFTELRALIEVPTVGRVTRTAAPEQLRALRHAAEETVAAARTGDLLGYLDADRRFHLGLLSLAGNSHLVEVVCDLRRRSRLHGLTGLAGTGVLVEPAQDHVGLLDVMLEGRAEEAEEHMRRHLARIPALWAARQQLAAPVRRPPARGPGTR
ncbi:MAG TPA: GntR family transcriptional regulator [Streptomyces sp.]|nr:GntR family transcriptional regulator [Streptomyces sp.]